MWYHALYDKNMLRTYSKVTIAFYHLKVKDTLSCNADFRPIIQPLDTVDSYYVSVALRQLMLQFLPLISITLLDELCHSTEDRIYFALCLADGQKWDLYDVENKNRNK